MSQQKEEVVTLLNGIALTHPVHLIERDEQGNITGLMGTNGCCGSTNGASAEKNDLTSRLKQGIVCGNYVLDAQTRECIGIRGANGICGCESGMRSSKNDNDPQCQ